MKKFTYYFGYLTFREGSEDKLVAPNKAVLSQFYAYWLNRVEDIPFRLLASTVRQTLVALREGNIRPLLELVSHELTETSGLHALAHLNESSIQTAIQMALSLTSDYKVKAEPEAFGVGYVDLYMEPAVGEGAKFLLELKYLKTKGTASQVKSALASAKKQLDQYAGTASFREKNPVKAAAVFSGTRLAALQLC